MENIDETIIKCGNNEMDFDTLKNICEFEAQKLLTKINPSNGKIIKISFWTNNLISELICIGYFKADDSGKFTYELDYSESTL